MPPRGSTGVRETDTDHQETETKAGLPESVTDYAGIETDTPEIEPDIPEIAEIYWQNVSHHCYHGFTVVHSKCLAIMSFTLNQFTEYTKQDLCGRNAHISSLHQLLNKDSVGNDSGLIRELNEYVIKWLDFYEGANFVMLEMTELNSQIKSYHCNLWKMRYGDKGKLRPSFIASSSKPLEHCSCNNCTIHVLCESYPVNLEKVCIKNRGLTQCSDGSCIRVDLMCDGKHHCPDGLDEINCSEHTKPDLYLYYAYLEETIKQSNNATSLMKPDYGILPHNFKCFGTNMSIPMSQVMDCVADCPKGQDEQLLDYPHASCNIKNFKCGDGQEIPISLVCDRKRDCSNSLDENPLICNISDVNVFRVNVSSWPCKNPTQIPCGLHSELCYEQTSICQYGAKIPCKNQHLRNCMDIPCPGQFKCPGDNSFCLSEEYVCDGQGHCPGGEDEHICPSKPVTNCLGKFRCRSSNHCIQMNSLCDGISDCKFGDDETRLVCDTHPCPHTCECLKDSVICTGQNLKRLPENAQHAKALILVDNNLHGGFEFISLLHYPFLLRLDLSHNAIQNIMVSKGKVETITQSHKHTLRELFIRNNQLTNITSFTFSIFLHLQHLDLQGNPLHHIHRFAFHGLSALSFLHLENMQLSTIEAKAFCGLSSLVYLNISKNKINKLSGGEFDNLTELLILDISNNPLWLISRDQFTPLEHLHTLHTPEHRFCCEVPGQLKHCSPKGEEYQTCSDIFAYPPLRYAAWAIAIIATLGNLVVIGFRHTISSSPLSLLVQNLGVADLLMGIYLLIIVIADEVYRGSYYLYGFMWRASAMCRIAGIISMLSSQMSIYVLTLIAADRIRVLGIGKEGFDTRSATIAIVGGWVFWLIFSLLPVTNLGYFGASDYIKHGVCFLYNLTEGKVSGWLYATMIFIVYNLIALCFLVIGYSGAFIAVLRRDGSSGNVEVHVACKLVLIVVTDCICWIPSITIGILSLLGHDMNPQFAVWVAIFILPINSALNPFLYTLCVLPCCQNDTAEESDVEDVTSDNFNGNIRKSTRRYTKRMSNFFIQDTRKSTRRYTKRPLKSLREARRTQRRTENRKLARQATLRKVMQRIAEFPSEEEVYSDRRVHEIEDRAPEVPSSSETGHSQQSKVALSQNIVLDNPAVGVHLSVNVDVSADLPGVPVSETLPSYTLSRPCSLKLHSFAKMKGCNFKTQKT